MRLVVNDVAYRLPSTPRDSCECCVWIENHVALRSGRPSTGARRGPEHYPSVETGHPHPHPHSWPILADFQPILASFSRFLAKETPEFLDKIKAGEFTPKVLFVANPLLPTPFSKPLT